MARKFALYLKDGHEVRNNIEEITEYFDYGKMVEYFSDGRLMQWLEDRHYEKEVIALSTLKANTSEFKENLCYIFKVDSKTIADNTAIEDMDLIKKRDLVKQYTNDENILGNIDKVAIDNNELLELIDSGITEIYLCGNTFTIPDTAENVKFIGVNKPKLVVRRYNIENKSQNNVAFDNVCLLDENGNAVQVSVSTSVENGKNTIADNTAIEDMDLIKKRDLVKQYTNDENILGNIDKVAIDNNELLELIDSGITEIYLCGNTFTIPDTAENVKFIGVNKPKLVVRRYNIENKSQNNVAFDNVCLLDENGNAVQVSVSTSVENGKNIEKVWNNVAAELLGVLIHGKLKNGEDIFSREGKAKEARRITYQAWPDDIITKDIDMGDVAGGMREHLYQHNKSIIGAVIEFCSRASNQYLIIADKAFYVQQSNCVWKTIRYEKIDNVQVYNNIELVIAQYNKQWWHLPFAHMWKLKMGLNNFRLFLLIAAKILGGCKYQFNKEELKKLRKVKLESLDGACILDYLE